MLDRSTRRVDEDGTQRLTSQRLNDRHRTPSFPISFSRLFAHIYFNQRLCAAFANANDAVGLAVARNVHMVGAWKSVGLLSGPTCTIRLGKQLLPGISVIANDGVSWHSVHRFILRKAAYGGCHRKATAGCPTHSRLLRMCGCAHCSTLQGHRPTRGRLLPASELR